MSFLSNNKIAAPIAAVICVLSLFLGTGRSLTGLAKNAEKGFYEGIVHSTDGYLQPSVSAGLAARADYALGITTFAINYEELAPYCNEIRKTRETLLSIDSISKQGETNRELGSLVADLMNHLDTVSISDSDRNGINEYFSDFRSAQILIDELAAGYNDQVDEYKKHASSFPASFFGIFAKEAPEQF